MSSTLVAQHYRRGMYVHFIKRTPESPWVFKNLMNGAVLRAPEGEGNIIYEMLNSPPDAAPADPFYAEIFNLLINRQFLVPSDADEKAILFQSFISGRDNPYHSSIAVVLTLQCNLRCVYCYQEHVDDTISPADEASISKFISNMLIPRYVKGQYTPLRSFNMTWWGGEPLLRMDAIERLSSELIPKFDSSGVSYAAFTSTNGVLLSQKNCEKLLNCRVNRFQITVDGPREFHDSQRYNRSGRGTFVQVMKGIENLCNVYNRDEYFITLRVNLTPSMAELKANWNEYFYGFSELKRNIKLNIHQAVPNEFYNSENALENERYNMLYNELIAIAKCHGIQVLDDKKGFNAGGLYCSAVQRENWILLPQGRLTKCTEKFHDRDGDCGRLLSDGTIELFAKADEWLQYTPFNEAACSDCSVLPICMGGCRALPFGAEKGDRCARKTHLERSLAEYENP